MTTTTKIRCTRQGCGKEFTKEENTQGQCQFHPGQPLFHDGLKGWNCCKKKVTTFDEFMTIPGCCSSTHSSVPTEAPKPVVTAPGAPENNKGAPNNCSASASETVAEGAAGQATEVFGAAVKAPKRAPTPPPAKETELELEDDLSLPVPAGSKCLRRGCGTSYVNEATSRRKDSGDAPLCLYHPGAPVFHEGSKGYSCCARKVLEFDEFLKLKGCRSAVNHRFLAHPQEEKNADREVELRTDWYQTPTTVILSVFGKKADRQLSTVIFSEGDITIDLKLPEGKAYHKTMPLSQPIIPAECKYEVLTTKVELTLRKANGISWTSIEPNDSVRSWTTFGVTGGMGTVGSKEMFLANDAPLYAASSPAKADAR